MQRSLFLMLVSSVVIWSTFLLTEAYGKTVSTIYWNSSNPIFHRNNSEHDITVRMKDSINFVCPSISQPSSSGSQHTEVSRIYLVDRASSDSCRLSRNAKLAGFCNGASELITVVFRVFTPNPNGLEFVAGQDYFFVSTSTGTTEGMLNEDGGLCRTKNMRLRVRVKSQREQSSQPPVSPKKPVVLPVAPFDDLNEVYPPRPIFPSGWARGPSTTQSAFIRRPSLYGSAESQSQRNPSNGEERFRGDFETDFGGMDYSDSKKFGTPDYQIYYVNDGSTESSQISSAGYSSLHATILPLLFLRVILIAIIAMFRIHP